MDNDDARGGPIAWKVVTLLIAASAAGELAVGVAAAIAPVAVMGLLFGASVEGAGVVAGRMAGVAVAALGLSWWLERPVERSGLRRVASSYLLYNFGVGALLVAWAWSADRPLAVSWLVGVLHLLAALTFAGALLRLPTMAERARR